MSDEQKTTREEPYVPFKAGPLAAIMEKMMSRQESGCDCAKMMSQKMSTDCMTAKVKQSDSEP